MGLPEDKHSMIFVILADMIFAIIREGTGFAPDSKGVGIALLIVLGILSAVAIFFARFGLFFFSHTSGKNKWITLINAHHTKTSIFICILQMSVIPLYLYSDNINFIMNRYGKYIGCEDLCIKINRILATALGLVVIIIFHFIPPLVKDMAEMIKQYNSDTTNSATNSDSGEDFEYDGWYHALDIIAVLIKVDVLYTTVVHTTADNSLAIAVYFVILFVGEATIIIKSEYAYRKIVKPKQQQEKNKKEASKGSQKSVMIIIVVVAILMSLSLPSYLLFDNHQPLDRAFNCDTFNDETAINSSNFTGAMTNNTSSCNYRGNNGTRLGFILLTFLVVSIVLALLFCGYYKEKKEKRKTAPTNKKV